MYAALGIVLIVAGAILTFAIDRQAEGVDIDAIGWILMAGGAVALLVALTGISFVMWGTNGPAYIVDLIAAYCL